MPAMVPFASAIGRTPVRPAPSLGEHTAAVLTELGVAPDELPALSAARVI
jgi:crotonobetainyl-CoA:carnitine CoA-transferase CaiB-like acyl-CoA transferase